MSLLLDTCAFLWLVSDSPELSPTAREAFLGQPAYLSVASVWEICTKYNAGKLPLTQPPAIWVPAQRQLHGVAELPLSESAVLMLDGLPLIHRDPFDRMLVCHALAHGLTILTSDRMIQQYQVPTLW